MKILAETTGPFLLSDLSTGDCLQAHRPSVIELSGFIASRIALGQVTKVADVPDAATDDEFAEFWAASEEKELAVASYLSKFDTPAVTEPETETPKRRGK